jgi:hypothetical protein
MNSLVKSLVHPLMEENQSGIALVPGGFKPPTLGHFYMINQVAKHTGVEKVIVLIGHKVRDGVTKEESKAIWDIYSKYLPSNVEIKIADNPSPISDISSTIKNNPDQFFYPVVGIRGEMDLGDLKRFDSMKGKYQNLQLIVIKSDEIETRISGTNTRAALIGGEKDRFLQYLPSELSKDDQDKIWNILTKTPLDESYAEPSKFDYPKHIKSLTEYMLDKGMDIRPLPKVKFVDNDNENASDFFGKTAYYDPNNRVIVLYTMNRHPKDIMRSFAHEMIHHMQNNENRLNNIQTQNTNEDGDLPEIEREAYEKGNMTFRNWTDTLTESIVENEIYFLDVPPFNQPKTFVDKLHESLNELTLSKDNAVKINGDLTGGTFTVGNITYDYNIKNISNPYKDLGLFYNIQFTPSEEITSIPKGGRENYIKILSTMYKIIVDFVEKEKPEYIGIASMDNEGNKNYHTIYATLTNNKSNRIPGYFRKDVNLPFGTPEGKGRFVVLKKSQSNISESIIGDKIECDNCGWSWKIKDGGDDLYICHKCGYDNEPINENKPYKHKSGFDDKLGKDPFGLNQFAREISEDTLNEGRYDKITNDISSAVFNHWKQDYENEVDASRFDQTFETDDLSIDVDANIEFTPGTGKLVVNGGADADEGYIEVRFEVDPEKLPEFWEEISMNLKDLIRHEIEHLTHGEGPNEKPSKYMKNDQHIRDLIDAKMLPDAAYFKLEKEIDANLQGMYLRAKKEKRKFKDVIDTYLDSQNITPKQKEEILSIWRGRLKALSLPKF